VTPGRHREPQPALALAVHRSEAGAMEDLVRSYQDCLFSFALRILQDPFEAQAVTQDVFMKAHRTLRLKYDGERCRTLLLRPWLFRIARNLALNRRRRRRSARESPLLEITGNGEPPVDSYAVLRGSPRHSDELILLEEAMKRLESPSRELVVLRFIEGLSYAEIASVLRTSEASIRGRIFRALRRLRTFMEDDGDHEM